MELDRKKKMKKVGHVLKKSCLQAPSLDPLHFSLFRLSRKKKSRKVPKHLLLPCIYILFHLVPHGVPLDPVEAWVCRFQQEENLRGGSYTCTDGTLLLRTCTLITWTLVMIFFWWPISVTPSLWMSLCSRQMET